MRRIHVVHIVESFLSGTFEVVRAICNRLDPRRFEVSILHSLREHSPSDVRSLLRDDVRLVHIPMQRHIRPSSDLAAFVRLYGWLRRLRPDVVHTHSSKAGFLGRFAACAAGVPRLFHTPHGYPFLMHDRTAGFYSACERLTRLTGATTIAVSNAEAASARSVSDRILVVLNGVDIDDNDIKAEEEPCVVTCGRVSQARGPDRFDELARRMTDVPFHWIGDGEASPDLRHVNPTGWLPRTEALRKVASCAVYLQASNWEGMPLSVMEAMALGRAVVASDIPAHREIIRPGVTGLLARSVPDYEHHIRGLLKDPGLRKRLGREARKQAEAMFCPRRMAEAYARIYAGIAA
jgi:glycosyltransferase involved in cell wall biosynthesis